LIGNTVFKLRIYSTREFYTVLADAIAHMGDVVRASKGNRVSDAFSERIMLAVTQVNGCRYCNYYHTKIALKAGVSNEEIHYMLEGELGNAPESERIALVFAQHYAETKGHPDQAACDHLFGIYGGEMANDILAYIRMIMFGNVYGIMFDTLRLRIIGQPVDDSSLWWELGTVFGLIFMIPVILVQLLLRTVMPRYA